MIVFCIIAGLILLGLIGLVWYGYTGKASEAEANREANSAADGEAERTYTCPSTGGAGICPSLSQYYHPGTQSCLMRPKMVEGYDVALTTDQLCDKPGCVRTRYGAQVCKADAQVLSAF